MKPLRRNLAFLLFLLGALGLFRASAPAQTRVPDVHYEPTPQLIVEELLKMAELTRNDLVYDLGCGDGRFVVTAARKHGARGVGIDIDPQRIKESKHNAQAAGVADRVKFVEADLFETDIREATVVALYLLPELNQQLRPKLLKDLKPGSRVVSFEFDMGDWQPDKMGRLGRYRYYLWVVPTDAAGRWKWSLPSGKAEEQVTLTLTQKFQEIDGYFTTTGQTVSAVEAYLVGDQIGFVLKNRPAGSPGEMRFSGRVKGDSIEGEVEVSGGPMAGRHKWVATRQAGK